jgi:exopolyphosphatase/guanosine-5'-triphosphate,3'-diphosphate pyrophosphatase
LNQRIAIIDLGTNTFNLLVVDKSASDFEKVFSTKEGVGLGLGGINKKIITNEAIDRAVMTLEGFLAHCDKLDVDKVKAIGTSAIRDANNKDEFLKSIDSKLNLTVDVISGEREAELIYQGVQMGYTFLEPTLIMDIGGGSTEFIYADGDGVISTKSFNIGTARIYQLFDFNDPCTKEDVEKIVNYLDENTADFFDDIKTNMLIGSSGSFETFYAIVNDKSYPDLEFEAIDSYLLNEVLENMIYSSLAEREKNDHIIPIRKKMAPIAAIKIKWIIDKLKIKTLTISPFAMKEGATQLV